MRKKGKGYKRVEEIKMDGKKVKLHYPDGIPLALYRIHWKAKVGGGTSLACVGQCNDGSRWMACANWTAPNCKDDYGWDAVKEIELIEKKT